MRVKLKLNLRERKSDKDGNCPIAISIRGGGAETFYSTGIKVHPDNWKDGVIAKGQPNYDIINTRLKDLISTAERDILNMELQGEQVTLEKVKALFRPATAIRGVNYFKYALRIVEGKNKPTKRRYTIEIDKLREYSGDSLSFAQITPQWLTAYYKYLTGDEVKNTHNTAINAFKVIRHVFNVAVEEKAIKNYPFDEWKYPQYKAPKRSYLTTAECDELYKLLDKKEVSKDLKLVTAFFLLECFSGIRVSDWGKFSIEKIANDNEMIFTTTKTDTPVRLPIDLMPSLNKILVYIQKHKLKYTKDGLFANDMLKIIAPLAGIDKKMTTHLARHTFATQCLSIGMSPEAIAVAMGITAKQVGTYAKIMPDKLRNELKRLGGGI